MIARISPELEERSFTIRADFFLRSLSVNSPNKEQVEEAIYDWYLLTNIPIPKNFEFIWVDNPFDGNCIAQKHFHQYWERKKRLSLYLIRFMNFSQNISIQIDYGFLIGRMKIYLIYPGSTDKMTD